MAIANQSMLIFINKCIFTPTMPTSCSYFLLGILHVLLLYHNSPPTTVLALHAFLLFLYMYTAADVKINMHLNSHEIIYFIVMHILEHVMLHGLFRYRLPSMIGGVATLAGLIGLSVSLMCCKITNSSTPFRGPYLFVRHPLHASLFLFMIGVCIYLSSFVSLLVFIVYVMKNAPSLDLLDEVYKDFDEYKRTVPSGLPFFLVRKKQKRD